jgi:hypothetical protein
LGGPDTRLRCITAAVRGGSDVPRKRGIIVGFLPGDDMVVVLREGGWALAAVNRSR